MSLHLTTPLCDLLQAEATAQPARTMFRDQPGREAWTGRPTRQWSALEAHLFVGRFSAYLLRLGLAPGAIVGLCLAGDTEATLSLLAVEEAGLTPCFLPLGLDEETLAHTVETAGIQAVVSQARIGDRRPADLLRTVAAGYFRLRFLLAFGPDVPDGVIDIDWVLGSEDDHLFEPDGARYGSSDAGLVTLQRASMPGPPLFRAGRSLVAATASFLLPARIRAGDRILSLLAPDDLKGLATGPVAALLAGATLENHGLFDGESLLDALNDPQITHLVGPGWIEPFLAGLQLPDQVQSVVLVHDAPTLFKPIQRPDRRIMDVIAFGEVAMISAARTTAGAFSLSLNSSSGAEALPGLLDVRVSDDGTVAFRGPAALVAEVHKATLPADPRPDAWRGTCFSATSTGGVITSIL